MNSHKYFVFSLSFCIVVLFASGQEQVKKYVHERAVQITTIEPDSTDYKDLEAIGNAIGDARIVMLGEQDHGDAPTFLAKTRLIKYLHEKKGFNVLAFESDFFSTNFNWHLVKEGRLNVAYFINMYITRLWTQCTACYPLFRDYIPSSLQTQNPLEVTGFDDQMATRYLLPILDSVLSDWKIPITTLPKYKSEILPLLTTWYNYTKDSITTDKIISIYKEIKEQMLIKVSITDFWVQTVENLIQQNLQSGKWKKNYRKDMNTRDKQMAANLNWLAQTKYRDQKIIVWAHNYHVSKYAGHYPEGFLNKAVTMGTVFTEDSLLMRQSYIIGFSSYEGTAGRLFTKTYKLKKPKANSFENWLNPTYDFAFVDFKKYNAENAKEQQPFYMSGAIKVPYHSSQQGVWNRIYDGVFYIKNMYPCER